MCVYTQREFIYECVVIISILGKCVLLHTRYCVSHLLLLFCCEAVQAVVSRLLFKVEAGSGKLEVSFVMLYMDCMSTVDIAVTFVAVC